MYHSALLSPICSLDLQQLNVHEAFLWSEPPPRDKQNVGAAAAARRRIQEEDAATSFQDQQHLGAAGTWKRCRRRGRPWVQGTNIRFDYGCVCMIMMLMIQSSWGLAILSASRSTGTRIASAFSPACLLFLTKNMVVSTSHHRVFCSSFFQRLLQQ